MSVNLSKSAAFNPNPYQNPSMGLTHYLFVLRQVWKTRVLTLLPAYIFHLFIFLGGCLFLFSSQGANWGLLLPSYAETLNKIQSIILVIVECISNTPWMFELTSRTAVMQCVCQPQSRCVNGSLVMCLKINARAWRCQCMNRSLGTVLAYAMVSVCGQKSCCVLRMPWYQCANGSLVMCCVCPVPARALHGVAAPYWRSSVWRPPEPRAGGRSPLDAPPPGWTPRWSCTGWGKRRDQVNRSKTDISLVENQKEATSVPMRPRKGALLVSMRPTRGLSLYTWEPEGTISVPMDQVGGYLCTHERPIFVPMNPGGSPCTHETKKGTISVPMRPRRRGLSLYPWDQEGDYLCTHETKKGTISVPMRPRRGLSLYPWDQEGDYLCTHETKKGAISVPMRPRRGLSLYPWDQEGGYLCTHETEKGAISVPMGPRRGLSLYPWDQEGDYLCTHETKKGAISVPMISLYP